MHLRAWRVVEDRGAASFTQVLAEHPPALDGGAAVSGYGDLEHQRIANYWQISQRAGDGVAVVTGMCCGG